MSGRYLLIVALSGVSACQGVLNPQGEDPASNDINASIDRETSEMSGAPPDQTQVPPPPATDPADPGEVIVDAPTPSDADGSGEEFDAGVSTLPSDAGVPALSADAGAPAEPQK